MTEQSINQTRPDPVTVDHQAVTHMLQFCSEQQRRSLFLVADRNTYAALGRSVESAIRAAGLDLKRMVFESAEVLADAHHILELLVHTAREQRTFIAVGSGTLTDITRFVSHRTGNDFISMPTAPSVDGFTSNVSPLVQNGVKITRIAQPALAIFADLTVLAAAPRAMIAAGVGDMLGKFTSAADFRLGHLLRDEPYDEVIAQRTWKSAQSCLDHVTEISRAEPEGVRLLMEALIESGFCMLDFGDSRPASGTEHHCSHFWEMKLLREGRPAILHGAKVGFWTIYAAGLYARLKDLSRQDISALLEKAVLPSRDDDIARMRTAYGHLAEEIIAAQRPFLDMTPLQYGELKSRILGCWDQVRAIAAELPSAGQLRDALRAVGGPISGAQMGLSDAEVTQGFQNAHYLRNRFTVRKLFHFLNLEA